MKHRVSIATVLVFLGLLLGGIQPVSSRAKPLGVPSGDLAEPVRVTGVRFQAGPLSSRVILDLEAKVPFKANTLSSPPRLYVDLLGAELPRRLERKVIPLKNDILRRARLAQNRPGVVRIVLDLTRQAKYRVFSLPDPARIVIVLKEAAGPSGPATNRRAPVGAASPASPKGSRPLCIVIDPGHGGKDPGAIGPGGLEEKNVVLDIALRVSRILKATGRYTVLLTRSKDVFVPLEERTAFANSHKADLFVSIHANASTRESLQGIATYRLGINPDQDAADLAARENKTSHRKLSDVELILKDLLLTSKTNDSILLARDVQSALVREVHSADHQDPPPDLGIREALFYVLVGAEMPAILAEVSFITNPEEEKLLATAAYRQKLAEGIARGVEKYLRGIKAGTPRTD